MIARFFRSDAMIERLGPTGDVLLHAQEFQLTYNALRSSPDGERIATYDGFNDWWIFDGTAYSDVVLSADPPASDKPALKALREIDDIVAQVLGRD